MIVRNVMRSSAQVYSRDACGGAALYSPFCSPPAPTLAAGRAAFHRWRPAHDFTEEVLVIFRCGMTPQLWRLSAVCREDSRDQKDQP